MRAQNRVWRRPTMTGTWTTARRRSQTASLTSIRRQECFKRSTTLRRCIGDTSSGRKNTWEHEPERWRCLLCRKLFKGSAFVHKHIRNKHSQALEQIKREVASTVMKQTYMRDPDRHLLAPRPRPRPTPGSPRRRSPSPKRPAVTSGDLRSVISYDDI
eukprot:Polyplicarium_translucidae@DN1058_c0_g2_i3.p3